MIKLISSILVQMRSYFPFIYAFPVIFCIFLLAAEMRSASAALKIDINQGIIAPIPIAIAEFHTKQTDWNAKEISRNIIDVILNDLEGSGIFRAIDRAAFLEHIAIDKPLNYANWRQISAAAVVGGAIEFINNNEISLTFKIWDPYSEAMIDGVHYKVHRKSWRRLAHKVADRIYQRMTGEQGYFDTRVLFISDTSRSKSLKRRLAIMDQDGANLKMLTDGKNLVLTPRFDHKSQRAIYVSYQKKIPYIYVLDIETGLQKRVGKFSGVTFAPRFAPDGHSAILSVARNGSTNIFSIDLDSNHITKLTNDIGAINTSPSYSPDGSKIVFNSDRAGSRQLYIMDSKGANITRISKGDGSYATPVWSPRGNLIAFTKIANGAFYIGVMRPDGSGEKLLTSSWLDEAPAWAPNGQVIIFTRQKPDGSSTLHSVNVTGYNERLVRALGNASEPSWSALLQ